MSLRSNLVSGLFVAFTYLIGTTACAGDTDMQVERAKAIAKALGEDTCPLLFRDNVDESFPPQHYQFKYKSPYDETARAFALVQVPCWLGAYNQSDVFVLFDSYNTASLLSFSIPQYRVTYDPPDEEERVKSLDITGYTTQFALVFGEFSANSLEITHFSKSRGLGDAFTSGTWRFENETFVLKRYAVDASYDGVSAAKEILNFNSTAAESK